MGPIEIELVTRRRGFQLCFAGWTVFAISMLLPVLPVFSAWLVGWECWREVNRILFQHHIESVTDGIQWLLYAGYSVTNLMMPLSLFFVFRFRNDRRIMRRASLIFAAATVHVFAYLVFPISDFTSIGPGYYAWLLSFGLVARGAYLLSKKRPELLDRPKVPNGVRTQEELIALHELDA